MWAIFSSLHTITKTKLHTTIIKTLLTIFQIPLVVFQTFCSLPTPCFHHTTHFHVDNSQHNQNIMFHHIHSTCFIMWAIFAILSQYLALHHFFQSCSHMQAYWLKCLALYHFFQPCISMLSNTRFNNYNKLKGNLTLDPKYWYFYWNKIL